MSAKRITDRNFFTRPAEELAKDLIGKVLCHKDEDGFVIKGRIKTTEVYLSDDPVTDANRSSKPTSQFMSGGHIHLFYTSPDSTRNRLDIVANEENIAESVLIAEIDLYDGPQKALWAMDMNSPDYDGRDLLTDKWVYVEDDGVEAVLDEPSQRKGINTSEPLRFSAKKFVFN